MKKLLPIILMMFIGCAKFDKVFFGNATKNNREYVNLLIIGQSNAVNAKESPCEIYSKSESAHIVYLDKTGNVQTIDPIQDRQHYRDASWCILADMIHQNTYKHTNIYNFAVGCTTTERWAKELYKWIDYANEHYDYDAVLWIQGESDKNYLSDEQSYDNMVKTFSHVRKGVDIYCALNSISRVQARMIREGKCKEGVDFDTARWYHKEYFTPNEAHLDILGFQWHAEEWFKILVRDGKI